MSAEDGIATIIPGFIGVLGQEIPSYIAFNEKIFGGILQASPLNVQSIYQEIQKQTKLNKSTNKLQFCCRR